MIQLENKKMSVRLIFISLIVLIITYLIKEPNDYAMLGYLKEHNLEVPLYLYDINVIGLTLPFKGVVIIFTILLGLGVYLFLYKTDDKIKMNAGKILGYKERGMVIKQVSWKMVVFLLITVSIIVGIILAIKYYSSLQDLQRPKTWGESIYLGFCQVFIAVVAISILITIIKSLTKKTK